MCSSPLLYEAILPNKEVTYKPLASAPTLWGMKFKNWPSEWDIGMDSPCSYRY